MLSNSGTLMQNSLFAAKHQTRPQPRDYLVALLESALLGRPTGHRPHDVGEEASVGSRLAAHHPHAEAAGCRGGE